jgi:hypothetical protein
VDRTIRPFASRGQSRVLLESPMGWGHHTLRMPTSPDMAVLLSLIPGTYMRGRALDWLMFDGLQEALVGRKKFCAVVNEALAEQGHVPNVKMTHAVSRPAAGRRAIGEARDAGRYHGEDPEDAHGKVRECDLFSAEAWKRRPELGELRIDGMDILSYYAAHFEPKWMSIDYDMGMKTRIDLEEARRYLEALRMPPFRYGSMIAAGGRWQDGYIQYTEKGTDWMHSALHRAPSNLNDQQGPDLRLDDESTDDYGNKLRPVTLDERGRPVLHLVGGAYAKDEKRAAATINRMGAFFSQVAQKIEDRKALTGLPPDVTKAVSDALELKDKIKKKNFQIDPDKAKSKNPAKSLTGIEFDRETYFDLTSLGGGIDVDLFLQAVKMGLAAPQRNRQMYTRDDNGAQVPQYKNLDALGPQIAPDAPEPTGPGGWWKVAPGPAGEETVTFKLPEQVQSVMYDYLTKYVPSGLLRTKFRMQEIFGNEAASPFNCEPARDTKFQITALFNNGVKSDPKMLKDFRRVYYTAPHVKPDQLFIHQEDMEPRRVNNVKNPANDPTLGPLWEKGYRWQSGYDFETKGKQVLGLGTDRFVVTSNNGQFFLWVPKGTAGNKFSPAPYGEMGGTMLSGGVMHSGGRMRGHMIASPAGKQTYENLLTLLMQGFLGEKGGASNEADLPSVVNGAAKGLYHFRNRRNSAITDAQLKQWEPMCLQWAVEGLRAFSGDIAFQIGYITPDEIRRLLGWDEEEEQNKFEKGMYIQDPDTGETVMNPEWEPGDGWGIQALLAKHAMASSEDQPQIYKDMISALDAMKKAGPIIDYSKIPAEFQKVLGENAYMARVRFVSKYVAAKLSAAHDKDKKIASKERAAVERTADGETRHRDLSAGDDKRRDMDRPEWEDSDLYNPMSHSDLRAKFGIPEPARAGPGTPTFGKAQRPMINPKVIMPDGGVYRPQPADNFLDDEPDFVPPPPAAVSRQSARPAASKWVAHDDEPDFIPPPPAAGQVTRPAAHDDEPDFIPPPPAVAQRPLRIPRRVQQPPQMPMFGDFGEATLFKSGRLRGYEDWAVAETEVVFDPRVKPTTGCGFNYWGTPGNTGGTSIGGEPDTAASDPTGSKGARKNGRKRRTK